MGRPLNAYERGFLLTLARSAIEAMLDGRPPAEPTTAAEGPLNEQRGAFVTLAIDGALRGCIGHVVGIEPLWRSVQSNALAAAFRDPRFAPLERDEFERIAIEISAMSPLEPLREPETIEIGRHGLLIERGSSRGLLLPQVASNNRWDRSTFLEQTCRKAGLDRDAWRDPEAKLFTFTVESFEEE
jgi:AmmeMemoRadiSam system protein A